MVQPVTDGKANRRTFSKLLLVAVAMFGFGYALVPLYSVLCDITGLNGKTGRAEVGADTAVDTGRTVTVELTGNAMGGLPWEFRPLVDKVEVHPGEAVTVKYFARNLVDDVIVGQAVPSVTPGRAATHFKKTECFCFTNQKLGAKEGKEMAVTFVVDTKLPKEVDTITLSYAFFNTDQKSAARYGGKAGAQHANGDHGEHAAAHNG